MAGLRNLVSKVEAAKVAAATVTGTPVIAAPVSMTDVDPTIIAKVMEAALASGTLAYAVQTAAGVRFALTLPNGSVVSAYINAPGTSAAKFNAIHPAKRPAKDARVKAATVDPLAGL